MYRKFVPVIVLFAFIPLLTSGQVLIPDSYLSDYYQVLRLQNKSLDKKIFVRPSNISSFEYDSVPERNIWGEHIELFTDKKETFHVLPIISSFGFNSKYPRGYNDGPVWKGKGFNADVNFGFKGNLGMLHYTFAPVVYFSQNDNFYHPSRGINDSLYAYQFNSRIDWVQRYGDSPLAKFHLGQSDLRLIYKKWTLGISTQNVVFGPAQINPILLSANAPMFPHVDLGTDVPIETKIGDFEIRVLWGLMDESDYFDANPNNDKRYFTGGVLSYRPSFLKGFSAGLSRVNYRDWRINSFELSDILRPFLAFSSSQDSLNGRVVNDVYDQMNSANAKWTFDEVGFEMYFEISRNDFSNYQSLPIEPEHTRALTLGFLKMIETKAGRIFKINYEHTTLGLTKLELLRPASPTYYTHHLARQGYTQKGQILGAGIGPGSNGDYGSVNCYVPDGMYGFSVQRIRFNDDYAFDTFTSNGDCPFDVEYTFTLKTIRFVDNFTFGGELAYSTRLNWYYEEDNKVGNYYGKFTIGYRLK